MGGGAVGFALDDLDQAGRDDGELGELIGDRGQAGQGAGAAIEVEIVNALGVLGRRLAVLPDLTGEFVDLAFETTDGDGCRRPALANFPALAAHGIASVVTIPLTALMPASRVAFRIAVGAT